jgi:hypothetical protein
MSTPRQRRERERERERESIMMRESFDGYALTQHRRTTAAATTGHQNGERKKPNLSFRCRQETQEEERLVQYLQRWQSMAGGRSADDAKGERRAMRRGDENTGRKKEPQDCSRPCCSCPRSGPTFYPTGFCRSVISCGQVLFVLQYVFLSKSPSLSASCTPLALLYPCRHSP